MVLLDQCYVTNVSMLTPHMENVENLMAAKRVALLAWLLHISIH